MSYSFTLSPETADALSALADTLGKLQEEIMSALIPAMTEHLEASRDRRKPQNVPLLRPQMEMFLHADDLAAQLDLLCGRNPHAYPLDNANYRRTIQDVLGHSMKYHRLRSVAPVQDVLGPGAVRTELSNVVKSIEAEMKHTTALENEQPERRGWFRGRRGSTRKSMED